MSDSHQWTHFAPAAARNWEAIADAGANWFARAQRLLEIGSGSGQHAATIGARFPQLFWQPSELPETLPALRENCTRFELNAPLELDADRLPWPVEGPFDLVYTANTLHIAPASTALKVVRGAGQVLVPGGYLLIYGPFRYRGEFTTDSNEAFDASLRARNPRSGIRDFEALDDVATESGLMLVTDIAMPANNQLLVWRKVSS